MPTASRANFLFNAYPSMVATLTPERPKILILKTDLLCASMLETAVRRVFPTALIRRESTLENGRRAIADGPIDLLLTGVGLPDGDTLDLLSELPEHCRFGALVITARQEYRILTVLKNLPVRGIFDPSDEDLDRLELALKVVRDGGRYWSASVLTRLHLQSETASTMDRLLSPTEKLVFAVIGDGSDDHEAAQRLNLRPSTVHSVRRDLHRKLGVRHRGELVRLAAQQGYVRFTPEGVRRPGFSKLLAACGKAPLAEQIVCPAVAAKSS